jgi:transcriptional regulator with XRE-family HTH domain
VDPIVRQRRSAPPGLGPMLAAARRRAGLSQEETARLAGIGVDTLRGLETRSSVPSRRAVLALADVLALDEAEREQVLDAVILGDGGWGEQLAKVRRRRRSFDPVRAEARRARWSQ